MTDVISFIRTTVIFTAAQSASADFTSDIANSLAHAHEPTHIHRTNKWELF